MPSVLASTNTLLAPSAELRVGDYTLLRKLGQGGSATIYLAEHIYLKNRVALKLLSHARAGQEEVRHFQFEADLLKRIQHRNIVQAFDFGWEQNSPFFTMAYAPGGTLRTAFRQKTPLSIYSILPTILQLASALQYVHNHFTTHGDVKPENVLLGPNKEIWLGDFGIATITSSGQEKSSGKRTVRGTARYMAPEQIRGNPLPASDQYALAIMMYEWLCGHPPFHGSALGVQVQHVSTPPPRLRDRVLSISRAVEHVVLKALEKDPHRRFADVIEFASELNRVVTQG